MLKVKEEEKEEELFIVNCASVEFCKKLPAFVIQIKTITLDSQVNISFISFLQTLIRMKFQFETNTATAYIHIHTNFSTDQEEKKNKSNVK